MYPGSILNSDLMVSIRDMQAVFFMSPHCRVSCMFLSQYIMSGNYSVQPSQDKVCVPSIVLVLKGHESLGSAKML